MQPDRARVLDVGNCDPDHAMIRSMLERHFEVEIDRVMFVAEAVDAMRRARVLVQPSRKEGWGLTVLEANACGTPVVATDVPGLRDAVRDGETGLLVASGDPAALARGILRVLDDYVPLLAR